ncbi:MAG: MFS transporter [Oscillospiraceae bacterium]|jgi:Na+/melibiose symporter-like transporter|nr:MFS transporter [Oscillospiraceae bacterium]
MAKFNAREFAGKLKANWKRPNEGEYLSIKEFMFFGLGGMGIYTLTDVVGLLGFSGTAMVTGMIFQISIMDTYVIGIIGTVIGFLTMPLNALITDNLGMLSPRLMKTIHIVSAALTAASFVLWLLPSAGLDSVLKDLFKHVAIKIVCTISGIYLSIYVLKFFAKKYGKFKPHMVLFGLPMLILATLFVFLPYKDMRYATKLILTHLVTNLITTFSGPYGGNVEKMQGLLTPNPQERMRIYAIAPMLLGLMRSIFGIVFPVIATFFADGQLNIATYRLIIPAFGLVGLLQGFLVIKAKERVIQPKDFKPKVNIGKALKEVFSNKYLWIRNISNLFGVFAGMFQGTLGWMLLYGTRLEWMTGIMLNLSYITTTPGQLIAPWFTKRYSKRASILGLKGVVLFFQLGFLAMIFLPGDVTKIIIFMIFSLITSFFNSTQGVISASLLPDIWDYQQWRSGERMEASTDLFGYITTPLGLLLGYVTPYMLKRVGLVRDWDILYDDGIRNQVIMLHIIVSIIGALLMTLPFIFYDLTPEKHQRMIRELRERAGEDSGAPEAQNAAAEGIPAEKEAQA